jgi:glycosyltransferase involved in cell wall biosynthesis
MIVTRQKILIACDSAKSLIDFRGKLIEDLAKQHQVYVFTPALPLAMRKKLNVLKVIIHENKLKGSTVAIIEDVKYAIALYKLIKRVRPDIFFPYTLKPVIYGTLAAKLNHVKLITPMLSGLGYSFVPGSQKSLVSRMAQQMLKFSLRASPSLRIIFQNKDDYQTLISKKILTPKHRAFVVNGSGVDLSHYRRSLPDTSAISFLMISRLINAKGIYEYYEAARITRLAYPEVKFKLIGSSDKNIDSINADLLFKIQYGDTVEYIGEVDDVRPYISEASVVVLPSYYGEGIPRCLLEAMATGRAIITCDSVGCRETVISGAASNGFLVPVKNVAELIFKIQHYIQHPGDIVEHGLNGLTLAKEKFDVKLINACMMEIMQLKTRSLI